jgi:hypothetical protein
VSLTPIVVLVSGTGSLLQALIDAGTDLGYGVRVAAVGADRPGTLGQARAEAAGIPTFVCRVADFTRPHAGRPPGAPRPDLGLRQGGLDDLVRGLHDAGVELVSTGGSAALIAVARAARHQGRGAHRFPRVPRGPGQDAAPARARRLLADTRKPDHLAQLAELGVEAFDLVVVNLYPFADDRGVGGAADQCVEQIDIGGPSMVRAAAKNHPSVAVVTDPRTYADVLDAVRGGGFTFAQRQRLAAQAFVHTATYDVAVASWMGNAYVDTSEGPASRPGPARRGTRPRCCATARTRTSRRRSTSQRFGAARPRQATQLHGKEMSYNNYIDADAAVRAAVRPWRPADGRDHQARQPVRDRCGREASPRPTARRTSATRSRRSAASSPPTAP